MEDTIYRQQAIDEINKLEYPSSLVDVKRIIVELPSAQPERKKGKCIWCDSPFRIEYYWIDREGNTASFQDEDCHLVATGIAKFCPNCGRRMGGEQNG